MGKKKRNGSSSAKKVIPMDVARAYLNEVKDAFKNENGKYDDFLWVMKDFKKQRMNVEGVISRVKVLLEGHEELLLKFNKFLPDGYTISPPQKNTAREYLDKVKTRFESEPHVYESFLDLLNRYTNKDKSSGFEELYPMVTSLFEGHPDLVDGFADFFPST